jgi:hypothetical protein
MRRIIIFNFLCVEKRKIILIVVSTITLAMLLSIGYYLLKGRGRKNRRTILRDNCKYYLYMEEKIIIFILQFLINFNKL